MPETSLTVYVFCLLTLSSDCYIQNCPRGGKKSVRGTGIRQSLTCGSEMKAHCFGTNTCCRDEFACLIDTPETAWRKMTCPAPACLAGSDEGQKGDVQSQGHAALQSAEPTMTIACLNEAHRETAPITLVIKLVPIFQKPVRKRIRRIS